VCVCVCVHVRVCMDVRLSACRVKCVCVKCQCECIVGFCVIDQGDEFVKSDRETRVTRRALNGDWWNEEWQMKKVIFAVKEDGSRKA
jgi:hypothetical protein